MNKKSSWSSFHTSNSTKRALIALASLAATTLSTASEPVQAKPLTGHATTSSVEDHRYPQLSPSKIFLSRPKDVYIYEWDSKPLGDRQPLLLVHGALGENFVQLHWKGLLGALTKDEAFNSKYKIYMARWNTKALISDVLPKFKTRVRELYENVDERPITVLALSMGGNLTYESMLEDDINDRVRLLFTLGTPFRGSPLFSSDWIQYSMYKNTALPITKFDHALTHKIFFKIFSNYANDLCWDNTDEAKPTGGKFRSLTFFPSGDLTAHEGDQSRLRAINEQDFDRQKLVTYGGYMVNPYMIAPTGSKKRAMLAFPVKVAHTEIPALVGNQHSMLRLLNDQVSCAIPSPEAKKHFGTDYVYQLNDGIVPVSSALFLSPDVLKQQSFARESDLDDLGKHVDVRLARVFRNIDHLSYVDGYKPIGGPSLLNDQLHKDQSQRPLFQWVISDLNQLATDSEATAAKSKPEPTAALDTNSKPIETASNTTTLR